MTNKTTIAAALAAVAALAGAHAAAKPYPLEQWAMRSVVSNVRISPDGKRLALLKIESRDGNPVIEVYDAADLSKEPFRVDAKPMELQGFFWLSDNHILFGARQAVRKVIDGFNRGVYRGQFGLLNLEKEKVSAFGGGGGIGVASLLPNKPDKVLISIPPPDANKGGAGPFAKLVRQILPRDYYEYDLKKGTRRLVMQGRWSMGTFRFDGEGNAWYAEGYDEGKGELLWYWRAADGDWKEFYRLPVGDFEFKPFTVVGKDEEKPDHVLVVARNGHDKLGLWSYDLQGKKFAEAIYRRPDVDVFGVTSHTNPWQHPGKVTGVTYLTDRRHVEYFDEAEGAIHAQLRGAIPAAHNVSIVSRSRDGASFVIANSGPRDPGTYYLLRDGALKTVGSSQPLFKSEDLADVEYHTYRARDGLQLAAYVTVPNGEAPHPLVVLPHGGPFYQDFPDYDKWAQLLANYGYLVVQPQFRGSTGFGERVYAAAFDAAGQQGHKMQDDKDDAAKYLVGLGLADPARMAMFGWSYGGYAAAAAASRTPQLYQCVIAGAAVFDPMMQINYYRWRLHPDVRKRHVAMDDSAIDPMEEVAKVNVPMLIVHGDVDQRVPVEHARKYIKLLEQDKYKYVELEMADHFSNTLFHHHQLEFFTAMIDFLRDDCGLGEA